MSVKKPRTAVKCLAAIVIALLLCAIGWVLNGRSPSTAEIPPAPRPEESPPAVDAITARPAVVLEADPDTLPAAVISDPSVPHDHSRPGPCARCLAEKELAPRRIDFAELHFQLISQSHQVSEDIEPAIREACRDFADAVLIEWSFSENRPLLPPDDRVQEQWQKILGPIVNPLPTIASP